MAIRRWDPFKDLLALHDNLNQLFELGGTNPAGLQTAQGAWSPTVDLFDRGDFLVLEAELPGLEPDDIGLEVRNRTLLLSGNRRFTRDVKEDRYHRIERSYGNFLRTFALPYEVDQDKSEASYKNGVLQVTLPRKESVGVRKIKVETE